jgi:hypothetical protein
MKQAIATLKSVTPYSQSKYITASKMEKESAHDHEKRCWRERMHVNEDGFVFIPPMAFKNSVTEAAKYLSIKIPGKNMQLYTKHFEAGVMVMEPLVLDVQAKDVKGEELFVPSNGQRGGKKRVPKIFPLIPKWEGVVSYYIFDDTITESVFRYVLQQSGKFIGLGRFRPRNWGYYGRFEVKDLDFVVQEEEAQL